MSEQKKPEVVKVRATNDGWYHGRRIRKGVVFVLRPSDKLGSWMEAVQDVPVTVVVPAAAGQVALSEMARGNASVDPVSALQRKK